MDIPLKRKTFDQNGFKLYYETSESHVHLDGGLVVIQRFLENTSHKNENLKRIYRLIQKYGPISKSTLIERTGLKQSTCARLIEELLQAGLIIESGFGESSGGRKPLMYQIQPDHFYVIGVDISRTHTKVLLMDLNLTVKEEAKLLMDQQSTPDVTIRFIENQIENMLERQQIDISRILGIGIGAVGPLDREHGMIINPLHFPAFGWENVPVCRMLAETFHTTVLLDNGANTAVLGEYRNGLWREVDSLVYNLTGIGFRCGVLTRGQVVRGPVDMEGAFGHVVVDVHGRKCTCGAYGCLETYATILAIREEVIRYLKRGKPSLLNDRVLDAEQVDFQDICWAVKENDPLCCDVIVDAAYHYGIGLSNMIYLIHPEMIILGGALVTEMDLFYRVATETALKRVKLYPGYEVKFGRGSLGENAVAVGAGCMVLDYYLQ
jgi:predicted NBD/HSP70 family sugar kinase